MPALEAATSVVSRFFASLYERLDLQEHFGIYHPDAWVLQGDSVMRAAELSSQAYEAMLGGLLAIAAVRTRSKPTVFELAGLGSWLGHGTDGLLTQPMREVKSGRCFEAVFHLGTYQDEWRLKGVAIPQAQRSPTLETIEAFVAAELALAPLLPEPGELLVTPLDVAFRRAFPPQELPFLTLSESRFTCQNLGHCCRTRWGIHLPTAARRVMEAVDWEHLSPGLTSPFFEEAPPNAPQPHRILQSEGDCAFHRQGGCLIHATVGHAPLPTCATYPVGFTPTPEGVVVWTSFACATVRRNFGQPLAERLDDFRGRHAMIRHALETIPEILVLDEAEHEVPYAHYRAFEDGALEVLAIESLGARERVRCLSRAVQTWAEHPDLGAGALRGLAMASEPIEGFCAMTWDGFEAMGLATFLVLVKNLPQVFQGPLVNLDDDAKLALPTLLTGSGIAYLPDAEVLTRYLRQVLHRKRTLSQLGVVGHVQWVAWIEALVRYATLALAMVEGRSATTSEHFEQALVAVEYAGFHSELLANGVLANEELRRLLRSPQGAITR